MNVCKQNDNTDYWLSVLPHFHTRIICIFRNERSAKRCLAGGNYMIWQVALKGKIYSLCLVGPPPITNRVLPWRVYSVPGSVHCFYSPGWQLKYGCALENKYLVLSFSLFSFSQPPHQPLPLKTFGLQNIGPGLPQLSSWKSNVFCMLACRLYMLLIGKNRGYAPRCFQGRQLWYSRRELGDVH